MPCTPPPERKYFRIVPPRTLRSARSIGLWIASFLASAASMALPICSAAPPGRAWTPIWRFVHADHEWMHTDRFEPTRGGKLELLLTGRFGASPDRTYGFQWRDSTWAVRWQMDFAPAVQHIWPALTDSAVQMLVFAAQGPTSGPGAVYMAFVEQDSVTPPDSIAAKYNANVLTVGTQGPRFRWAAAADLEEKGWPELLVLYAKPVGAPSSAPWNRIRTPPEARFASGVYPAVAAEGDSTCIVVWYDGSNDSPGLTWGVVNDTGWVRPPELIQRFLAGDRPVMKRLPSGDLMVLYGNKDSVSVLRTLRGNTWSGITALRWSFPTSQQVDQYFMYSADMSLDHRPLPVLTATSYNSRNGSQVAHVAVPDSGRYARGEWIPGSLGAGLPFVARDENGDVWLAWSKFHDGAFWLHSYVTSTCEAPTLSEAAGRPRLSWMLSDRTPESAWRVLRSADDNPFEPLERVIAGDGLELTYVDSTAPPGARLRYRIRRESRDTRYVWESESSMEWHPRTRVLSMRLASANPSPAGLQFELTGANAGNLELRILDLQGRTMLRRKQASSGLGRDVMFVSPAESARLRAGVYLARVRASDGAESRAVKVAVVR